FAKGVAFGGSYTLHFSDMWAWEVGHFSYSYGVDTGLKKKLLDYPTSVIPTSLERLQYFASSSVVLKPFYGKFSWLNRSVIHTEIFFVAGAGVGRYENPNSYRGSLSGGVGLRLYLSKHTSLRLEVRENAFFAGTTPLNELYIAMALAIGTDRSGVEAQ
ncbi:MAG: outer membrane beta-barrel domain-containing protein, partial [Pseudomonadota bacterium]